MRRLPVIKLFGKRWYVDDRLRQWRNVSNPHDFIDWDLFDRAVIECPLLAQLGLCEEEG